MPNCALASLPVSGTVSNVSGTSLGRRRGYLQWDYWDGANTHLWSAKSRLYAGMPTSCGSAIGPCLVGLVERLISWLLHFSCAQRLLAERMIIIVAHFRTQVVKFIFAGRNSGQSDTKAQDGWHSNGRLARTEYQRSSTLWAPGQLLRLGSWITTSSETARTQVCPSNWIRSAE